MLRIVSIAVLLLAAGAGGAYLYLNREDLFAEEPPTLEVEATDPNTQTADDDAIEDAFADDDTVGTPTPNEAGEAIDESLDKMIEGSETVDSVDSGEEFVDVYEAGEDEYPTEIVEEEGSGHAEEPEPEDPTSN